MATSPIYSWPEPDNTDLVKNGALSIRTLGNAIDTTMATMTPKSLVDAKGDLFAASANDTPARLAVGNNGETLVADSSATTGLRYQGNYAAGKNKLINGDLYWNQRNFTSLTNANTGSYSFDRWSFVAEGSTGSATLTPQVFTPGTAPVAGYEGTNFAQIVTASQGSANCRSNIRQPIEDVRTFAGQTITVSFWAKAASGTPKMALECAQVFGSGGSATVNTYAGQVTLSASWARYSLTVAIPSISGKTIGTSSSLFLNFYVSAGSDFDARTGTLGNQNNTFQLWGFQAEVGSVATAFQTATGTLQGELAACQRYYYRLNTENAVSRIGSGFNSSANGAEMSVWFPSIMRTSPTALEQSGTSTDYTIVTSGGIVTSSSVPIFANAKPFVGSVTFIATGLLTAGQGVQGRVLGGGYLGWSAEL